MSSFSDAKTLVDLLRQRAQTRPEHRGYTFLADSGEEIASLTHGMLDRQARSVAAQLQSLGAKGERALLLFPPGLEFVSAFLGCLYAGAIAVPAYPPKIKRVQPRLRSIVRDARPRVVLTVSSILSRAEELIAQVPELESASWVAADQIAADTADAWRDPAIGPDELAFLQYTSGSTALPKGVMVSHGNIVHNEAMIRRAFEQSEDSVIVGWLPLYHDMGLIGNVLQPLYSGARCILMSPLTFLQKPLRWLEAISRYRGTTSGGPNFAYDLCVRKIGEEERAGLDLGSWSVAFNGAEPIRAETLQRFVVAFGPHGFRKEAFYPCYGLAEATLFVTGPVRGTPPWIETVEGASLEQNRVVPVTVAEPSGRGFVACGREWLEQRLAIVDPESGAVCPPDRVGEIWISGPSVAHGYWGNAEATEHSFQARLAGTGEGPFLRTGDLGFTRDGQLFIAGRLKDLIIIRGRNLYPQDIELLAEQSHAAVRPGCGAAFSMTVDGEERLIVACEIERSSEQRAPEVASAVRRAIAEEYEVQIHDVVLVRAGSIPKTSSGKIQRHACRAGYLEGSLAVVGNSPLAAEAADELPVPAPADGDRDLLPALAAGDRRPALRDLLGRELAAILRVPAGRLDPEQPVTNLGLDSLVAVELVHRLKSRLGVSLPLADLFQGPTLTELADLVLEGMAEAPREEEAAAPAAGGPAYLSYGQRAIWFLQSLAPDSAAYNIAVACRLEEGYDDTALQQALEQVVRRHPALRTRFGNMDGEPIREVDVEPRVEFLEENAAGWSDDELSRRLHAAAYRPFDLHGDPLVRWVSFRRPGSGPVVLLVVHHIVADLWSLAVFLRELGFFYHQAVQGTGQVLPLPALDYDAYVRRQRAILEGRRGEALRRYWSGRLAGELPVSALMTDFPRPPVQTFQGSSRRLHLDAPLVESLRSLGRRQGATLYMVLLSGLQTLLHRLSGQEDILVGSPTAGRDTVDLTDAIGYFVNPVVLRSDLSGAPSFEDFLAQVRRTVVEAFEHQDYPFPLLVERLQPNRDPSRSPIFQIMLALQSSRILGLEGLSSFALGEAGGQIEVGGLRLTSAGLEHRTAQFDLELLAADVAGGLGMALLYNAGLFEGSTVERMLRHLANLLRGAADEPARGLLELPLLDEAERRQLLTDWNDTAEAFPLDRCFHELFEDQAARTPEAPAALCGDQRLTYRELNARANRLARVLVDAGAAPERLVAVLSDRDLNLLTSLLAILKTGAVYLPLDPLHPRERLRKTLEQSGCRLVLAAGDFLPRLADGTPATSEAWTVLPLEEALSRERADANLGARVLPSNLAYVIYTSGSTGTPKGVMVEQRGMINHLFAKIRDLEIGAGDVLAETASQCFDISIWQFLTALVGGGQVRIFDDEIAHDPVLLLEETERTGITILETVPSLLRAMLETMELRPSFRPSLPALRWMVPTGEALPPTLCARWFERYPEIPLVNAYGPTECSDDVSHAFFRGPLPGDAVQAPIGRPVANMRLYVLDRALGPVPAGTPGEIHVGGVGVGRGYLFDPRRTAEAFIPDSFAGEPGVRLYKTGDLGRWHDGQLEFLGRIDHQVKIRGFRIELGEIEAVLGQHPGVRQVVVLARPDARGESRLVAYLVPVVGDGTPAAGVRELAQGQLPEYMVPAAFVPLAALPLTPNGKIDRKALPEPDWAGTEPAAEAAPRTPVEELIAGIWSEVLGLDRVGVDAGFFEIGGHSLLATQVTARMQRALGVEIPLRALFEQPTVSRLALYVERLRATGAAGSETPPIRPVPRPERIPLSFAQQRLWFLHELEPESPAYNMPGLVRLSGRLDAGALEASLNEVVRRHESLRTTFRALAGAPVQHIAAEMRLPLPLVDLTREGPARSGAQLARMAAEEARLPFDLLHGPLLRARLIRLAETEHVLLLTMHHVVSDGWSQGVLVREMSLIYEAFAGGRPSPLPELPVQYADYALWQREWLHGEVLEGQLDYWRGQLAGSLGTLDLPLDRPRPPMPSYRGDRLHFFLPDELARGLRLQARRDSATLFMTLMAAFQTVLHRWSGQGDIPVGTPIANRRQVEIEDLIGFFTNTLVIRARPAGDLPFADLVAQVREAALGAYVHQDLPFERLVDELHPVRDLSRPPLFQVMFVLQNAPVRDLALAGLALLAEEVETGTAKFDITLSLEELAEGMAGWLEYSTDLFDPATQRRMIGHLRTLLEGVVASPGARLAELSLLAEAERAQLLIEWNDTRLPPEPVEALVHRLFGEQARRTPEAVAVVASRRQLTYGELDERSNRLARHLRALGVGPDVVVGLCTDRSVEMVVGLLGILKAGGTYLPLDPSYPPDRLAFMLGDSGAPVVVAEPRVAGALPETGLVRVELAGGGEAWDTGDSGVLGELALAGHGVYVIYTSGSTGRPKGVVVSHGGFVNLVRSFQRRPGFGADDVLFSVTTLSFDMGCLEVLLPLTSGARLVLADRATATDGARLGEELAASGATVMQATPATWHLLMESGWNGTEGLEAFCGGEAISREFAQELCRRTRLAWNMYGPTETTVYSAIHPIDPQGRTVPMGRPVASTRLHIFDSGLRPAPVGVPGELYIGGSGLARGYLGRPDLTAERFLPDPLGLEPGSRLYKTGDLARYLPNGDIDYLGRLDHQVKIRGYRIELQEIEATLATHPEIQEAIVVVRGGAPEAGGIADKRLVAFLVANRSPAVADLRSFLRGTLPEYMVPARFVFLDALPLTPNGKVDRRALPDLRELEAEAVGDGVPPRNGVEQAIAGIWSQVLGTSRVGVHDNFFDLGGHSLLVTQVVSRLQTTFEVKLPLRALFEKPTVAGLAEVIEAARRDQGAVFQAPPIRHVSREEPLLLSFAQERLWVMSQLVPDSSVYNVFQALRFVGPLDLDLLERCFEEVVRRHESLRTGFATLKGRPFQVVTPAGPVSLPVIDLSVLPPAAGEEEIRALALAEARRPFELSTPSLLRVRALRLAAGEHVLLLNMHHIICDDWSVGILTREIAAHYDAWIRGIPATLPELPVQYADFAAWQREWLQGGVLDLELEYWKEHLSGDLPVLALPTDRPRPVVQSFRGGIRQVLVPALLTSALKSLSLREGRTLFMTLLAAFASVLHRCSGQDEVVIGSPVANRSRVEIEGLIGFFVNILPLRVELAGARSYQDLLARVHRAALGAYDHQNVPFERLVEALQVKRDLSRAAVRQVGFALQNTAMDPVELPGGITVEPLAIDMGTSRLDITLFLWEAGDNLQGYLEYSSDLFDPATIDRFAGFLQRTLEDMAADPGRALLALPPLVEAPRLRQFLAGRGSAAGLDESNLTESQLLFWFTEKLQPDVQLYFDRATTTFTIAGELDPERMQRALQTLVDSSDSLRSQVHEIGGMPRRIVRERLPVPLELVDLSGAPDSQEALKRWLRERCAANFDFTERLFDCALVKVAPDRSVWFWSVHHIIADAWSLALTARRLSDLYARNGDGTDLPPLPPYQEFVDYERERRATPEYEKSRRYWQEKLQQPYGPNIFYRKESAAPTTRTERISIELGDERSARVRELVRREGFFSPAVVFASVLFGYLHRLSGERTLRIGTPLANRSDDFRQTIGLMMNACPLQVMVEEETLVSLLRNVQMETIQTSRHQGYPVRNPEGDRAWDVYYNFQTVAFTEFCGLPVRFELLHTGHSNDALDLQASDFGASGRFRLDFDFSVACFDEAQRMRSAGHYLNLLDALLEKPDQPLAEAPLLAAAERRQVVEEFNRTERRYPGVASLPRLFEAQVARNPKAVAVSSEEGSLTYGELNQRANQLARFLHSRGVAPGQFVGVCMERSLEMVVALYGIHKAGCAYVPLDPAYPDDRLRFMTQDADVPVLLTQARLLGQLTENRAEILCLDRDWERIGGQPDGNPDDRMIPELPAYMIYTSGSTGRPKGVVIPHSGIANRLFWMQEAYGMGADDRVLQKTPFSFDVSVWELFWPLLVGARLVMARPGGHQDPAYLARTIRQQGITTLHFVPSMLEVFLDQPDLAACASLRRVFCSGEALPEALRKRYFERLSAPLHNLYGPTEASVDVTFWECRPESTLSTVPIGRPIANTQIYLLDRHGSPAPLGIAGELHIGGVNLAQGYLNRPELTAEKFVPDPFSAQPGARLYRTGDLARSLPDGNVEFLGRIDFQVKLRGFRIELAEIEAAIAQHPGVRAVVVTVREDRPGDKRLVSYFVPGERPPAAEDLRELLRGQLPDYMVPSVFASLEAMPLTPSGKVDRKALPAPDYSPNAVVEYVAPRTPLEAFLAGVFAEVLGLERVSVHGDFFDLGGNSLMATQVATLVQEVLPLEIPLRDLFEARTVARVVETLEQSREQIDSKQQEIMDQMLSEIEALFGEVVSEESAVG